jgi:hypothetical protein
MSGQDCISLNDIEKITIRNLQLNILGGVFTGVGGVASALMGGATVAILIEGGWAILGLYVVLPVGAVAIMVTVIRSNMLKMEKTYKKTKWNYGIKNTD